MVKIDHRLCDRCGACVAVCPVNALLIIHEVQCCERCTECGTCVQCCPFGALAIPLAQDGSHD